MSYSRARTHEKNRARKQRRFRFLLTVNALLLAVLAAGIWFVLGMLEDQSQSPSVRQKAAVTPAPSAQPASSALPPDEDQASPGPSATTLPVAAPQEELESQEESKQDAAAADDQPEEKRVTLAFVGDVLPAGSVARLMAQHGYDYPFREARSLLESADITAGNLESAITDRGTPAEDKQFLFRGPAEALPAIRDAGFDVLSLANNHTLDYGLVGLRDTMDALDDHGIHRVGAGEDDKEAFAPVYIEANGITVAFIGVTNVVPEVSWKAGPKNPGLAELYDPRRAIQAVQAAAQNADIVVVMAHWGIERKDAPEEYQRIKGRQLIDAGADLIIGSHPHVLQGFEFYNGKWIAHSLGNFVFNMTASPQTSETGVLVAECSKNGDCELTFHPMKAVNSQPKPMDEETGRALLERISAVSAFAEVKENGQVVAVR